ncbi:MAG: hypothetical protein AAF570_06730 [Bacteroidota bacterium]
MKANLYFFILFLSLFSFSKAQVCIEYFSSDDSDDDEVIYYVDWEDVEYETKLNTPDRFPSLLIAPYGFLEGRPLNGPGVGGGLNISYTRPRVARINLQLDRPLRGQSDYQAKLAETSLSKNDVRRFLQFDMGVEFFFHFKARQHRVDFVYEVPNDTESSSRWYCPDAYIDVCTDLPVYQHTSRSLRFGLLHYQAAMNNTVLPEKYLVADDSTVIYDHRSNAVHGYYGTVHTNLRASAFYLGIGTSKVENAVFEIKDGANDFVHRRFRSYSYADLIFAPLMQLDPVLVAEDAILMEYSNPVPQGVYEVREAFPLNRWGFRMGVNWIDMARRSNIGTFFGVEMGIRPGVKRFQNNQWIPLLFGNVKAGMVLGAGGGKLR